MRRFPYLVLLVACVALETTIVRELSVPPTGGFTQSTPTGYAVWGAHLQ